MCFGSVGAFLEEFIDIHVVELGHFSASFEKMVLTLYTQLLSHLIHVDDIYQTLLLQILNDTENVDLIFWSL